MEPYPVLKQNYGEIDPIIDTWARENTLYLYKEFKEVEVRSVEIFDKRGKRRFQIWVDPLNDDGSTTVHVWEIGNYIWERKKNRPTDLSATTSTLRDTLEKALKLTAI